MSALSSRPFCTDFEHLVVQRDIRLALPTGIYWRVAAGRWKSPVAYEPFSNFLATVRPIYTKRSTD